ncbi:helix-turn-helix domain-containing protein [Sporosarcina psychrophila]|uniref:Transcriptional regulator n=1 Tax=Sporosarcina psychrophila TaxID=1476 RepID=A0ABV2KBK1_SPOPS
MRASSNLKAILDERNISIQQFARDTGLKFETLRRLYNDDTKQFQRDTIGRVCEVLDVGIDELIVLIDEDKE